MPRRKIAKEAVVAAAKAVGDDDLPELTDKQMKFVEGLLEGKTASEAYRGAFDCTNMAATTIWPNASRLCREGKISAWLSAAKKAHLGSAVITRESHVRELDRLKELALEAGNHGAAIQAEQLRGKASALYVERYENVTPPDPVKALRAIAKFSPTTARNIAVRDGIPLEAIGLAPLIELQAERTD